VSSEHLKFCSIVYFIELIYMVYPALHTLLGNSALWAGGGGSLDRWSVVGRLAAVVHLLSGMLSVCWTASGGGSFALWDVVGMLDG